MEYRIFLIPPRQVVTRSQTLRTWCRPWNRVYSPNRTVWKRFDNVLHYNGWCIFSVRSSNFFEQLCMLALLQTGVRTEPFLIRKIQVNRLKKSIDVFMSWFFLLPQFRSYVFSYLFSYGLIKFHAKCVDMKWDMLEPSHFDVYRIICHENNREVGGKSNSVSSSPWVWFVLWVIHRF